MTKKDRKSKRKEDLENLRKRLASPILSPEQESNPSLHRLYTVWALKHLAVMKDALDKLNGFANLNCMDAAGAMRAEMRKLVFSNAAYRDAAALLFLGENAEQYENEETSGETAEAD